MMHDPTDLLDAHYRAFARAFCYWPDDDDEPDWPPPDEAGDMQFVQQLDEAEDERRYTHPA